MSVDRAKILEAAQKHLAKGALDKAIAEFQKLVKADPSDVRTWLKIGDLHSKRGATKDAVDTYALVADQYSSQGFFLKAVAVHKQILKLDPTRLDVQIKLAEAYENLQLVSDALGTYEQVAAQYARAGNIDRALATLGKMVELDVENIPIRIKYAEALSKAGRTKEAAESFEAGGRLLRDAGRMDDWIKVAERLLFHRPEDVGCARELSRLYLERNDAKRALAKLQICFKADPKDVPTLEMLGEAFHQLGQLPKTISVYREVARIHQEAGRGEERARILKRILDLDPGDAEARQALASYAPARASDSQQPRRAAAEAKASVPPSEEELEEIDEEYDEDAPAQEVVEEPDRPSIEPDRPSVELTVERPADGDDVIVVDEEEPASEPEPAPMPQPVRAPSLRPGTPSLPPEVAHEAQIAKLLTECDVFLRYGLKPKVIDQLRRVVDLDPGHVEARERLKNMLVEKGDVAGAVGQLLALAEIAPRKGRDPGPYLQQALGLDPHNAEVAARLRGPEPAPVVSSRPPEEGVLFVEDHLTSTETTGVGAAPTFAESASTRSMAIPPPPSESADLEMEPSEAELEAVEADPLAPISPEEFESAPLRPSAPEVASVAPRASMPPGDVEELLDEADFFVAQGLYEEAKAMLRDSAAAHPRNRLIADKLAEIEEAAAAAAPARPSVPPADDQSFELAEKLAEDLEEIEPDAEGSDVLDVEQVFAQFKRGVEAQVGLEDTETHFDLGIAYKEMGLIQDAIAEFQLCTTNPQKTCIAHTMIGICLLEKNEVAEAIAQFKKGLYADRKTDREELGLYYELGRAHELLHDPKEALYYYEKVRKRDPGFRNVAERIAALSPAAPASGSAALNDDIDAAFEDLMGGRDR